MLFNSLGYAAFLPIVLAVYYVAPRRWRIIVLLLASYWFYGSWNAGYVVLLVLATAVNFAFGLWLAPDHEGRRQPRWALAVAVGINVSVLLYYKYLLYILTNAHRGLGWLGIETPRPTMSILLPLGISFFTFEFVHYLADVWSGRPPVRSPLKFAVFAAFFPTQIAGPIKRFEDFVPQLDRLPAFRAENIGDGLMLILRGLFKKLVLADNLAPIVARGFSAPQTHLNPADAWLVAVGFGMQIYFDFSGYTDIGRGSALMLGFHVPENFRSPYLARNVSDFWRRWHISLSTWMRDYVYIPLGGRRDHLYRNLLITMVIAGAWHGARSTFLLWGAYHGVLLVAHRAVRDRSDARRDGNGSVIGYAGTFLLVTIGWVLFRAGSVREAARVLAAMVGWHLWAPPVLGVQQRLLVVGAAAAALFAQFWGDRVKDPRIAVAVDFAKPALCAATVAVLLLFHHTQTTRFIYFQF